MKLNKELCYKIIVNSYGNPHINSIILLEEIVEQHKLKLKKNVRSKNREMLYSPLSEGWRVGYGYIEEKYRIGYAKARYALRKLEKYNLISREQIAGGLIGSEIYIKLNMENIKELLEVRD